MPKTPEEIKAERDKATNETLWYHASNGNAAAKREIDKKSK